MNIAFFKGKNIPIGIKYTIKVQSNNPTIQQSNNLTI
jgi:hypothetical protein